MSEVDPRKLLEQDEEFSKWLYDSVILSLDDSTITSMYALYTADVDPDGMAKMHRIMKLMGYHDE